MVALQERPKNDGGFGGSGALPPILFLADRCSVKFLGAFLTILRLERGTGALIHAPLHAAEDDGIDLSMDVLQPLTEPVAIAGQLDVMIAPSSHARTVHITRAQQDLWADPADSLARFRDRSAGRFEFLLLGEEDVAHLRTLMRRRWVRGSAEDGPDITLLPTYPFTLDLGMTRLDLRRHKVVPIPRSAGYELHTDVGEITITPAGNARAEIFIRKREPQLQPGRSADVADWRAGQAGWLQLEGAEEFASPPITVCDADRDWMYKTPYGGHDQLLGRHRCRPLIARETNKYVMLSRFCEGIVFDESGICNEDGYLLGFGYKGGKIIFPPAPAMRCEQGRLFVDRAALQDAPVVPGDTLVFLMGNLSNYTHWLIDGLLALHIMLDHVPAGAKLLLPGTFRAMQKAERRVIDHFDSLRVFGFDKMPSIEIDAPYCRLENAYWLEGGPVFNVPGEYLRSLRARVAGLRPAPARRDGRLYIARRLGRRVANAEALAPFLERQGFATRYLEDYSIDEQVDMFSQAEWVISPHGAELGNLLFCQPGTKVLELAPDFDYKSYFSHMCNKLGLTHGVLPSPTTDTSFSGDMIVDMRKFTSLFRMLKNRL